MRAVRWEVNRISRALRDVGAPVILLKGAAYLAMQLPAARGASFSDVDVLVPKARLSQVESALLQRGWMTTHQVALRPALLPRMDARTAALASSAAPDRCWTCTTPSCRRRGA